MTIVVTTSIFDFMTSMLQKELKQTKPFTNLREEVSVALQFTAETLKFHLTETLKTACLTPSQYNVLRILRGVVTVGASVREISERMITKDSDVTRLLDRLEANKLVRRERQTKDRRIVQTYITDKGLSLLTSLNQQMNKCYERQLGHLSEKQLVELSKLLDAVRNSQN